MEDQALNGEAAEAVAGVGEEGVVGVEKGSESGVIFWRKIIRIPEADHPPFLLAGHQQVVGRREVVLLLATHQPAVDGQEVALLQGGQPRLPVIGWGPGQDSRSHFCSFCQHSYFNCTSHVVTLTVQSILLTQPLTRFFKQLNGLL